MKLNGTAHTQRADTPDSGVKDLEPLQRARVPDAVSHPAPAGEQKDGDFVADNEKLLPPGRRRPP